MDGPDAHVLEGLLEALAIRWTKISQTLQRASKLLGHHPDMGDCILCGLLLEFLGKEEEGGLVSNQVEIPLTLLPPVALYPVHDLDVEQVLHLELDWGARQPPVPLAELTGFMFVL